MSGKDNIDKEERKIFIDWVPGIIRNDFVRKFISLFFACLVYFTVSFKVGDVLNVQNVPVSVVVPPGLVDRDTEVKRVRVTLRGSKRALSSITASDVRIRLDVQQERFTPSMPYNIKINVGDIRTPVGTRAVSVTPEYLTLNIEEQDTREIPVQARFDSMKKLPVDLKVGKVKLSPPMVAITGPKSMLENIESVPTVPIPLDGSTIESFEYNVKLASLPGARTVPGEVKAEVEIVREFINRTFKSVPIRMMGSTNIQGLKVELLTSPHAEVILSGARSELLAFKPDNIRPYVDISGFDKPGTYMVDLNCWVDDQSMKIVNVYPAQVQIKITAP
ncbi:MAG: hypothetical protein JXR78_09110 [Victivallales bacterium]|nr:hypothetical protein [Victivallales bacterium]